MKAIGIKAFLAKEFNVFDFEGKFLDSFGKTEKNMRIIVYGSSGNGKTEFSIQLAKYLCNFGQVYYNSFEQGISKTLQDAILRNDLLEHEGKLHFGDKESYGEMIERLNKKRSPQIIFIDSRDYLNLTADQFRALIHKFPTKAFVIICWESNGKPKGEYAKAIEFMCDIKIQVSKFIAYPRSRFGGNENYVIWDKGAKKQQQPNLFN